ncbi:MAG TPA: hypothetical protein VJ873_13150, partial [bacterium]|nr:hypothetical protein [bacterium]
TINSNLRILYMSGAPVQDADVLKHLRRDQAYFIAKPFSMEELDKAVKLALGLLPPASPRG